LPLRNQQQEESKMRKGLCLAVAIAAICLLTGFAGIAGAAGGTPTKVTIKHQSIGFFGFVKTDRPNKCSSGRKVTLYKMKGDRPKPRLDVRLGSDRAQANGDGYMWSINTNAHRGDFYAKAAEIPGCAADLSRVVSL
jgi:hypothetical protein